MQAIEELVKALEHLVKAEEKLGQASSSSTQAYIARHDTQYAISYVRFARKRLRQEKEE